MNSSECRNTLESPQVLGEPQKAFVNTQETWMPDPLDFLPTPRKPVGLFRKWPASKQSFWSFLILGVAALVSTLVWTGHFKSLAISGNAFYAGEYWRAFTALLAHADEGHILSNGMLFVVFGTLLKSYFGWVAFPLLPFIAGVISNIVVVTTYAPNVNLLGMSGMVYAMVAMWLVLYIRFEDDTNLARKSLRTLGFALLMLFPQTYDPQVSYLAHSSGFILGATLAFMGLPYFKVLNPRR